MDMVVFEIAKLIAPVAKVSNDAVRTREEVLQLVRVVMKVANHAVTYLIRVRRGAMAFSAELSILNDLRLIVESGLTGGTP